MEFTFNAEGKSYDELCKVERMRAAEIIGIIVAVKHEIQTNHELYSFSDEKNGEQLYGLVKGKCLAKFFEAITDTQERCIVMFAFDRLMDDMCDEIARTELKKKMHSGIKEAVEELFGKIKKDKV